MVPPEASTDNVDNVKTFKIIDLIGHDEVHKVTSFIDLRNQIATRLNSCTPCITLSNPKGNVVDDSDWNQYTDTDVVTLHTINDVDRGEEMKEWDRAQWRNLVVHCMNNHDRGIIDALDLFASYKLRDPMKKLTICLAAERGHSNIVKELIESGDITEDGRSDALINACIENKIDVVQILLDNGCNVRGHEGGRALYCAYAEGFQDIIDLLERYGAKNMRVMPEREF